MKESNDVEEIALFDKYLDNELSDSERKEFENRLATDESFSDQYSLHAMLVSGIRKYCFKKEIKEYERQQQVRERRIFTYAAAACITAFVAFSGGGYYQNYSVLDSQQLVQTVSFSSSMEGVLPEISSEKTIEVNSPETLQKLVDKLQKQNNVTPQEGLQDEIDWMQAMIYAKEHKIFKTRNMLKKISKSDSKYQKNAQNLLDELWF